MITRKCPIRFLTTTLVVVLPFCRQESARKLAKCLTIGSLLDSRTLCRTPWKKIGCRFGDYRRCERRRKKVWACILSSFCHKLLLLLFALMLAELLIVITLFTIPRRHRDNRIFINAQIKYGFSLGRRQPVIHCVWKNWKIFPFEAYKKILI